MITRGKRRGRSIKFLVFGLIGLQALFLLFVIGFSSGTDFWRARVAAADRAQLGANRAASAIEAAVERAKGVLASEAVLPGYASVFGDPSGCTVTSGGADVFAESTFHVVRSDGSVACTSTRAAGGLSGPGYAGSEWLGRLGAGAVIVAGPLTDPVTTRPSLIVAAPIRDVRGALVLSLDLASLGVGLRELDLGDPAPAYFVLDSARSAEIAHSSEADARLVPPATLQRSVAKGTETVGPDGVERIFAEATVDDLDWHVLAGISSAEVNAQGGAQLRDRLLLAGMLLLIVAAVGWTINRRIADPIRELDAAVEDAAHGRPATAVASDGPAELARLADRFNSMIRIRTKAEARLVTAYDKEREAADQLRELNELKNAFLLAISHELRTPLTSVVGYAALLEDEPTILGPDEISAYARAIGVSARRLDTLLADLLDIERLQRGVLEARCRPTGMRELVRRVLEHIEADGRVTFDIPRDAQADVDPALVERMVENLVRNALKHTNGGARVHVRSETTDDRLVLVVEDEGQGIPDELKTVIFEPFRHGTRAEHTPGTGIGLTLVAEFAKVHGGRAWVEDREGGGSSFRVSLPLTDTNGQVTPERGGPGANGSGNGNGHAEPAMTAGRLSSPRAMIRT